tara:strand:+ start:116 stop:565 length:450 start_codon:yes stop_codon:yes gene_type:complete
LQNQTKLAIVFTLLSSTALADAPCDYKVDNKIIYEGHIESVKLVSKSVDKVPKVNNIQNCKVSIEARVDGKWYPSTGEYMFGPDMSQIDACTHAEDRAKKGIMREIIPETLKSEKSLNCLLTNVKKSCKVIYMNTNIGKIKFMESCDER